MARTILEIYDEMVTAKQAMTELNSLQPNIDSAQTFLNDLTSASKVAVWRSIFFVIAVMHWSVEVLFDEHKRWIENRAKELIVGTAPWHRAKALEFQLGHDLEFNGTVYRYAVDDPASRIVQLASVNELGDGSMLLKLAKLDGAEPEPLDVFEILAFRDYIKKVKIGGSTIVSVSRNPDLMKIHFRVYRNVLVMDASGALITDPGVKPVEDAINSYCKNLPFNGRFSITELTDRIQAAAGVENPVFEQVQVKYGANPYKTFLDAGGNEDYYIPNAGYLKIDPAHQLSTTITYLP